MSSATNKVADQIASALMAAGIFFLDIRAGPGTQITVRLLLPRDALKAAVLFLEAGWRAKVLGNEVRAYVAAA